jgi:hypothetical protein
MVMMTAMTPSEKASRRAGELILLIILLGKDAGPAGRASCAEGGHFVTCISCWGKDKWWVLPLTGKLGCGLSGGIKSLDGHKSHVRYADGACGVFA